MGKVIRRGEEARQQALNILRNGGSLDEAAAATGFGREYVRQLGAKEGIRFSRGKYGPKKNYKYNKELIIDLYRRGYSSKETSDTVGCSVSYVIKTWEGAGLKKQLTPLQRKVKELRDQGKVSSEIRETLGISAQQVGAIAKAIGMPFTEEEKRRSFAMGLEKSHLKQFGDDEHKREHSRKYIDDNHPGWTYIDGFIGKDEFMTIRCEKCGSVIKKSACTVRTKGTKLICPICHKAEMDKKAVAIEEERAHAEKELRKAKREKFWNQDFKQISFKQCPECGNIHIERGAYCSDQCSKKALNRRHDRRLDRASVIDPSITLEKLYKRDGGVCWICGGQCDWNDYRIDEKGNFIVGYNYPSKDHVAPLARGGNHTWDNIKLAHWLCNTLKRDKVVS